MLRKFQCHKCEPGLSKQGELKVRLLVKTKHRFLTHVHTSVHTLCVHAHMKLGEGEVHCTHENISYSQFPPSRSLSSPHLCLPILLIPLPSLTGRLGMEGLSNTELIEQLATLLKQIIDLCRETTLW